MKKSYILKCTLEFLNEVELFIYCRTSQSLEWTLENLQERDTYSFCDCWLYLTQIAFSIGHFFDCPSTTSLSALRIRSHAFYSCQVLSDHLAKSWFFFLFQKLFLFMDSERDGGKCELLFIENWVTDHLDLTYETVAVSSRAAEFSSETRRWSQLSILHWRSPSG